MNIGDYIKQTGSDFETFGIITKQLKNGSFYAKVFTSHNGSMVGKAKQVSIKSWYPAPIEIEQNSIPVKILNKLNNNKGQKTNDK